MPSIVAAGLNSQDVEWLRREFAELAHIEVLEHFFQLQEMQRKDVVAIIADPQKFSQLRDGVSGVEVFWEVDRIPLSAQLSRLVGDQTEQERQRVRRIWERFRPQTLERVKEIEQAVSDFVAGHLDSEQAQSAIRYAHQLAGSVGSFGYPRSSQLARELEVALEAGTPRAGLAEVAAELRADLQREDPPA